MRQLQLAHGQYVKTLIQPTITGVSLNDNGYERQPGRTVTHRITRDSSRVQHSEAGSWSIYCMFLQDCMTVYRILKTQLNNQEVRTLENRCTEGMLQLSFLVVCGDFLCYLSKMPPSQATQSSCLGRTNGS